MLKRLRDVRQLLHQPECSGEPPEAVVLVEASSFLVQGIHNDETSGHRLRGDHDPLQGICEESPATPTALVANIESEPGEQDCWYLGRAAVANAPRQIIANDPVPGQAVITHDQIPGALDPHEGPRHASVLRARCLFPQPIVQRRLAGPKRAEIVTSRVERLRADIHSQRLRVLRARFAARAKALFNLAGASSADRSSSKNSAGTFVCVSCSRRT